MSIVLNNNDSNFPKLLKEISDCPKRIFCLGNIDLLKNEKTLAVVGSRKMSQYGREVINLIVPKLVVKDFVLISGMAMGVDAEVHKVCVENQGKTIGVLASAVDVISPKCNEWIYEKILRSGGLLISEFPDGTKPERQNFVGRNRIIAGISKGILVVEGGRNSGTLTTVGFALEQGKEVLAVPGRINDENSWTPNYLIKNGAVPMDEIDIITKIFC